MILRKDKQHRMSSVRQGAKRCLMHEHYIALLPTVLSQALLYLHYGVRAGTACRLLVTCFLGKDPYITPPIGVE